MIFEQCEGRQELIAGWAGDQVIIPDDAEIAFTALNADLVAEPAGRVAIDLAGAQELHEPVFQAAADVITELGRVLVATRTRGTCRQRLN